MHWTRIAAVAAVAVAAATTAVLAQMPPQGGPGAPPTAPQATQPGAPATPGFKRGERGERGERGAGLAACRADMDTLCRGTDGGRRGRMQCLVENRAKVSAPCADVLSDLEARGPRARPGKAAREGGENAVPMRAGQACRADAQALCGTMQRGAERMQCLRQNETRLSPECRTSLTRAATLRQDMRLACRTDRQTLCRGDAGGERGGSMRCLREHQAQLSAQCAAVIGQLPAGRMAIGAGRRDRDRPVDPMMTPPPVAPPAAPQPR